jgi:hypothetical protein
MGVSVTNRRQSKGMAGRLGLVAAAAALLLGAGVALAGPALADPVEDRAGDPGQVVTDRDEIIARAQTWLEPKTPYDMNGRRDGYRTDCSGYVSMAWGLPIDTNGGLTTVGLSKISHEIAKDELLPGDILLDITGNDGFARHVVMFAGWANDERTDYVGYETADSAGGTVTRTIPFPYFPEKNPEQFIPRRADHL